MTLRFAQRANAEPYFGTWSVLCLTSTVREKYIVHVLRSEHGSSSRGHCTLLYVCSCHMCICQHSCMYVCMYIYIVLFHGAHDITAFHLKCWEPRKSPRTRTWSRPPSTKSINWQLSNSPNRPNGVDVLSPKFSMRRF